MNSINWKNSILKKNDTLKKAIEVLSKGGLRIVMVSDEDQRLLGTITDGDVRRALITNIDFSTTVDKVMFTKPTSALISDSREKILSIMKVKDILQIPLLDEEKKIVGLEILQHLLEKNKIDNHVFLMAGGYGKRLMPLTKDTPKPLLKVGNIPILEKIIIQMSENGFNNFIISTHYKSEMFRNYFGNGSNWNVNIEYVYEEKPLGTAGSLGLLKSIPKLPILVMNSDLLTKINFENLITFHHGSNSVATVCARNYEIKLDYGILEVDNGFISKIEEKPKKNYFINAGIYMLNPEILKLINPNQPLNMTDLLDKLLHKGHKISIFPVHEYWIDIGQQESYNKALKDEEV